jgi:peroxiredoxin Q/BCP
LRDQAARFAEADCVILGISFDTPEENKAFREKYEFPFRLLSDHDEQVGVAYQVREPGTEKVHFAKRRAYLVDPGGVIRAAYEVTDVAGFADAVLADLERLRA